MQINKRFFLNWVKSKDENQYNINEIIHIMMAYDVNTRVKRYQYDEYFNKIGNLIKKKVNNKKSLWKCEEKHKNMKNVIDSW